MFGLGVVKAAATGANPGGALLQLLWKPVLVLAIVAGAAWWIHHRGYEAGEADRAAADQAQLDRVTTERNAARADRDTAVSANANLAASELELRGALASCNAENERLADEGLAAVQAAEAEKTRAERDLASWRRKHAGVLGSSDCTTALANLARACPVGSY